MKKTLVLVVILLCTFLCGSAFALPGVKQWQAKWDANSESDVGGYYLYWRTPNGTFTNINRVDVGNNTYYMLTGNVPNKTEIAVTCYDISGNESEFSSIVPFDKDGTAPGSPGGLVVEMVK